MSSARAAGRVAQASRRPFFTALQLLVPCLSPHARQGKEGAPAATASGPREITLAVTVTDAKARYLSGLNKEQFTILDGGTPRDITSFNSLGEAASVGVLFDISSSMRDGQQNLLEAMRRAFARFAQQGSSQNEYFLRAFHKESFELTGWTRDARALREALGKIAPDAVPKKGSAGTALYDACAAALKKLAGGSLRKRVLLVLTDGGPDNSSREVEFKNLKRMARDSGALIYSIAFVDRSSPAFLDRQAQTELDELTATSGGRAFFPDSLAELYEIADRVAVELSQQYMIGFVPADAAKKGELNKLKVKVQTPPNIKTSLHVRHREGYFTPG